MVHDGGATAKHAGRRRWSVGLVAVCALAGMLSLCLWGAPLIAHGHARTLRAFSLPALFYVPHDSVGDNTLGGVTDSSGSHQYWQVGLIAGPEASDASGMRTTITTVLPQQVANRTTNYYWIGSYLADGSFVQVGYYVAWYNPAAAGWFYCAFSPTQQKGPCVYGPEGSAGADGTAHAYTLETAAGNGSGQGAAEWTALVDSQTVGSFGWTSGTTGTNSPGIYAESSGFTSHAALSILGPVDFVGPVATRPVGQADYQSARHARPAYDADDVCPPYGVASDGAGGALLGSYLGCPAPNQWLW
jgi:hypothetical protein